jgi:hypothetical protein
MVEVCRSHTIRHTHTHTHAVGLLLTSDQLVAEVAAYTTQTEEAKSRVLRGIRARDPSNQP